MKKKLHKYVPYLVGTCLLAMVACGSDDDDNGSGRPGGGGGGTTGAPDEQQETIGTYRATLAPIPLNTTASGNPTGRLDVVIEGDEFKATMNMEGVPASIVHAQHIMLGTSCPTEANDVNNDSFIDIFEGIPNYGLALIPLDGDLEDQDDGKEGFPRASADGSYTWTKTASLSRMIADLQDADVDPEDALGKLSGNELNLAGKVVIVHGVREDANLPDSVRTIDDFRSHESLPIACGVIERVQQEEGGTTGGDDTTTTGGDTGGTNGNGGSNGNGGPNGNGDNQQ